MARKRKQKDDDEYTVEYIIEAEPQPDSSWKYLVKWYGWEDEHNSLEPESNLKSCSKLLERFWSQFPEQKKWKPGIEGPKSSEKWIQNEREYCAKHVKKKNVPKKKARLESSSNRSGSTASLPAATPKTQGKKTTSPRPPNDVLVHSSDSSLSPVPMSPGLPKNPPAPKPNVVQPHSTDTAVEPSSTSTTALMRKRRTPRDKPQVKTSDDEGIWEYITTSGSGDSTTEDDMTVKELAKRRSQRSKGRVLSTSGRLTRKDSIASVTQKRPHKGASTTRSVTQARPAAPLRRAPTIPQAPPIVQSASESKTGDMEDWEKDSLFDGSDIDSPAVAEAAAIDSRSDVVVVDISTSTKGPTEMPESGVGTHVLTASDADPHSAILASTASTLVEGKSSEAESSKQAALRRTSSISMSTHRTPAHRAAQPKVKMFTADNISGVGNVTKNNLTKTLFALPPPPPPPRPPPSQSTLAATVKPILSVDIGLSDTLGSSAPAPSSQVDGLTPATPLLPEVGVSRALESLVSPIAVPDDFTSIPVESAALETVFDIDNDNADIDMVSSPIEIENDNVGPATLESVDEKQAQISEKVPTPEPVSAVSEPIDLTSSPILHRVLIDVAPNSPKNATTIRSEADDFLRSMGSIVDLNTVASQKTILPLGKIPKKWVWEGDILLGTETAAVCRARLHEPHPSSGVLPMFKVLFNNRTCLRLSKTYAMDQRSFFFPLLEVQQWAKFVPAEDSANDAGFVGLSAYLELNDLFSLSPLPIENDETPYQILLFHNTSNTLVDQLHCPTHFRPPHFSSGVLAAIVIPPRLEATSELGRPSTWQELARAMQRRAETEKMQVLSQSLVGRPLVPPPHVRLPPELKRYLSDKVYTIHSPDLARHSHGMDKTLTTETRELQQECAAAGASRTSLYFGGAHVVFIHLDHIRLLGRVPGMSHRRGRADIQFWTYGTSSLAPISSQTGGVRQIFPHGGVVTFTPRAVAQHPDKVTQLIDAIDQHPLWVCYVIPEVVALVKDITMEDHYEKSKLTDPITAVSALLNPIHKGRISLVRRPPPLWDTDATAEWDLEMNSTLHKSSVELLDYCVAELAKRPCVQRDKEAFLDQLIYDDMRQMEVNPAINSSYRRFVIVYEDGHTFDPDGPTWDGYERVYPDAFFFGDDLDQTLLNRPPVQPGGRRPSSTTTTNALTFS